MIVHINTKPKYLDKGLCSDGGGVKSCGTKGSEPMG